MEMLFSAGHEAHLTLDEKFMTRAKILRGNMSVDADFLMHLLETGLQYEEDLQQYYEECDRREAEEEAALGYVQPPDDIVCDAALVAEFQTVRDRSRRIKSERKEKRGRKARSVRVTLNLAAEDHLLAAYLAIVQIGRCRNPDAYPVGMEIDAIEDSDHRRIVRAYVRHAINQHLERSMQYLEENRHICFRSMDWKSPDDIPF